MYLRISEQALVFCYSALLGACCGVGYDFLRLVRANVRNNILCLLADVVYVLLSCLALLGFVLTVANGQMRWYVLLGVVLGGMLYAAVFGLTVFRILSVICRGLLRLLHTLGRPLEWISRSCYRLALRCRNGHRKKKTKLPEETSGQP